MELTHLREPGPAAPSPPSLSLRHPDHASMQSLVITCLRWWGVPSLSGTRKLEPKRGWEQKKKTTCSGSLSLEEEGSRCPIGPSRDWSLRSKQYLWFEGCGFCAVEMEVVGMSPGLKRSYCPPCSLEHPLPILSLSPTHSG